LDCATQGGRTSPPATPLSLTHTPSCRAQEQLYLIYRRKYK